jgi:hypothetical protein
MKRTLALLLPMVALILLLADGRAGADMWGPGSCFGGNSHDDQIKDAKDDTKDNDLAVRLRSSPSRNGSRRVGVGLLSVAFATSGWLFFRRQGPKV